jgi:hypothetical protein
MPMDFPEPVGPLAILGDVSRDLGVEDMSTDSNRPSSADGIPSTILVCPLTPLGIPRTDFI